MFASLASTLLLNITEKKFTQIVNFSGERNLAELRAGHDQLPEQVSPHSRLGRPLQQAQGEHQPGDKKIQKSYLLHKNGFINT